MLRSQTGILHLFVLLIMIAVTSCSGKQTAMTTNSAAAQPDTVPPRETSGTLAAATTTIVEISMLEFASSSPPEESCDISVVVTEPDSTTRRVELRQPRGPCVVESVTDDSSGEVARVHCQPMSAYGAATGSYLHFIFEGHELIVLESEYGGPQSGQANPNIRTEIKRIPIKGNVPELLHQTGSGCGSL